MKAVQMKTEELRQWRCCGVFIVNYKPNLQFIGGWFKVNDPPMSDHDLSIFSHFVQIVVFEQSDVLAIKMWLTFQMTCGTFVFFTDFASGD